MSKKKQPKHFKNSPFSNLKGLSVPEENKPAAKRPAPKPSVEPAEEDFDAAMDSLGVKKLQNNDERLSHPTPPEPSAPQVEAQPVRSDEDEFLAALGQLDVRFKDEFPEAEQDETSARRMKQLRRGKIRVEGEVDLHGLTRTEALEKFQFFLTDARYQGWQTVRVITGQGHHSEEGPVVRDAIENLLRRQTPAEIIEWGRAPQRQGGQGALILFLRSPATPD